MLAKRPDKYCNTLDTFNRTFRSRLSSGVAMSCSDTAFHGEHFYPDDHNNDAWCRGNYEVIATYGPWRIILDPDNQAKGYIDTDPESDLPNYAIDSARVHEGEPDGHTWRDQIGEKIWAQPYLADFAAALAAAQARWPRA